MEITKITSSVNTTGLKNRQIKYIVIHYTAGITSKSGTAKSTAKYFAKETAKASADFIIDDEFIIQFNPDLNNRYCWHCGGSKYKTKGGSLYKIATSANSIGIEICSTNDTGKITNANDSHWSFSNKVINNTIELVKYLMQIYKIDIDHVIRHYDVTGKLCPGITGWNADTGDETKWESFKQQLIPQETKNDTAIEVVPDKTDVKKTLTVGDVMQIIEAADEEPIDGMQINPPAVDKKYNIISYIIELVMKLFKK